MEILVFEKKILEDKIKTIDYLFNRIITERVRDSMEPKYSLLLGAGCSLSSDIVSAKGIIHMLEIHGIFEGNTNKKWTKSSLSRFGIRKINKLSYDVV